MTAAHAAALDGHAARVEQLFGVRPIHPDIRVCHFPGATQPGTRVSGSKTVLLVVPYDVGNLYTSGQLAHEYCHAIAPHILDPVMEGVCTMYMIDSLTMENDPSLPIWANYLGGRNQYADAYRVVSQIVASFGRRYVGSAIENSRNDTCFADPTDRAGNRLWMTARASLASSWGRQYSDCFVGRY